MTQLTQDGFGFWLLGQGRNEIVGYPEDPRDCPLCWYLISLGLPRPSIQMTYSQYWAAGRPADGPWCPPGTFVREPLAEWATKFQHDSMDVVGTKTDKVKPITAFQAINALNTAFGKRAFRDEGS